MRAFRIILYDGTDERYEQTLRKSLVANQKNEWRGINITASREICEDLEPEDFNQILKLSHIPQQKGGIK